jgi:hypothetical protein
MKVLCRSVISTVLISMKIIVYSTWTTENKDNRMQQEQ